MVGAGLYLTFTLRSPFCGRSSRPLLAVAPLFTQLLPYLRSRSASALFLDTLHPYHVPAGCGPNEVTYEVCEELTAIKRGVNWWVLSLKFRRLRVLHRPIGRQRVNFQLAAVGRKASDVDF